MRSTLTALTLLLIAASTAFSQVPRTINFQGRARDAAGVYLDGQKQMTIRLYDAPTGGTALYSDVQTVQFANGLYTAVIGGGPNGPIPASIPFDQQYWIGVQIQGFNNDQELTPRLRLSSTPYTIRAITADSSIASALADFSNSSAHALHADSSLIAGVADSSISAARADSSRRSGRADSARSAGMASGLTAPIVITGTTTGIAIDVNGNNGTGIRSRGPRYASISDGIDSTTKHFVAAETTGTSGTPVKGGYYRDNAPLAWGLIAGDGSIITDFGILSVTRSSQGVYVVLLDLRAEFVNTPGGANIPSFSPIVQPSILTDTGALTFAQFRFISGTTDADRTIVVHTFDSQQRPVDIPFSIHVFGRAR